ncbi:MAG: beta-galactosidase [Anaerolineales bacterium]|nr:beta-galactosidase [Anaerolineales bacterium]
MPFFQKLPRPVIDTLGLIVVSCFFLFFLTLLSACQLADDSAAFDSTLAPIASVPAALPVEKIGEAAGYAPTVDLAKVMSSPDYGMQVFLYWREEVADRDLKLVQEAGFRWVKQEIPWREIEGHAKGAWQWDIPDRMMDQIDAHGLKVVVRLGSQPAWVSRTELPAISPPDNLQDFYDYVYAVASRYRGRIEAYQIWNEPNLAREWGNRPPNPAEYTELLKIGYQAVKAVDPQAVVISAGLAPTTRNDGEAMPDIYFVQGMYEAGAAAYFDALGVHAAGYKSPPEADPAEVAADPGLTNGDNAPIELRRVYSFRHVEDIRALMVRNGDAAKKVVILEVGWSVDPRPESPYRWHAVTLEQQDKYLQRAYAYAQANWQPWIGLMSLIYIANPQWDWHDEQTFWSVVYPGYPQLQTAPAYYGLLTMPKVPPVEVPN